MIEKKIETLCRNMEGKKWTKEAEEALLVLMRKELSYKEKVDVMSKMFPNYLWSIPSIASKERRINGKA